MGGDQNAGRLRGNLLHRQLQGEESVYCLGLWIRVRIISSNRLHPEWAKIRDSGQ